MEYSRLVFVNLGLQTLKTSTLFKTGARKKCKFFYKKTCPKIVPNPAMDREGKTGEG